MPKTNIDHIRIHQNDAGEWRWTAKAANNETLATGEAHTRHHDATRAAKAIFGDDIRILDPYTWRPAT